MYVVVGYRLIIAKVQGLLMTITNFYSIFFLQCLIVGYIYFLGMKLIMAFN